MDTKSHKRQWGFLLISVICITTLLLTSCVQGGALSGAAGGNKKTTETTAPEETQPPTEPPPATTEPPVVTTQPPSDQTVIPTEKVKGHLPITICHATGSATNPYVEITIDDAGVLEGHMDHEGDLIPAPKDGCPSSVEPTKTPKEKLQKITLCHATGSATNPYVEITISYSGLHGHEGHADDIIPAPAGGCPQPTKEKTKQKWLICHATGSETNPYVLIEIADAAVLNGHSKHPGDIIPAPAEGCPGGPTITPSKEITPTLPQDPTVTPPPPPDIEPIPAPCVDYVLFHTFRDDNLEIYRLDGIEGQSGSKIINISNSTSVESRPHRSPDQAWVVYESDKNGNIELYLADSEGKTQRRLTNTTADNINAMFSPDGKTIAYQSNRNGNWDIFLYDLATGTEKQLTASAADDINPYYSPDPRWLAYQSNSVGKSDLFIVNIITGNENQVTSGGGDNTSPAWSPDGKYLAYLGAQSNVWTLFLLDMGDFSVEQISDTGVDVNNISWSPNSQRLAYQSDRAGNLDIYAYDLPTSAEYRSTVDAATDSAPTWDCSSENIIFTSMRDGVPALFKVFWQGGSVLNLTNNPSTNKWSDSSNSREPGSRGG